MISKIFSFFLLSLSSFVLIAAELVAINPEQLETLQKQQQALVVDIRTEKEWATTGLVPHSQPLQFFDADGKYDLDKWLLQVKLLQKSPQQPLILVCRAGNRSEKLGKMLANERGMTAVYHLENGLNSWAKAGKLLEKSCYANLGCK
jgi:rhodanese-related sulfurtransferase